MMPRKPFKELSKSQRNRRLKHVAYDESLSTSPQQSSPSDSNQSRDKTTPDIIICDTQNVSDQTINTDKGIPEDTAITEDAFCDSIVVTNVTDNVILTENRELRDNHDSILLNKTPDITDAKINLQRKLAQWQCQYNIRQAACGALLKILIGVDSVEECNNLPKDPPACRSVLYSVSRKLDTLLNIVGDNPWPNTIRASDVLPNFPICKHEDLVKFNDLLTDKEAARTQYEDFIKQRQHLDGKKCIRIVLGHILSGELSCKLSCSGQKNTIKVEKMPFVKYLRETVTATSRSSLDECKQSIMSWMQHANDRIKKIDKIHA